MRKRYFDGYACDSNQCLDYKKKTKTSRRKATLFKMGCGIVEKKYKW